MNDSTKTERTLGDLSPLELVQLALDELSKAIDAHEKVTPGPACGAYAYLSLAKNKLAEVSEPQRAAVQTIHEVSWRLRKEVTRETYERDLAYASDLSFPVHEWRGEDRDGEPMIVVWVVTPAGDLLSAYEIQGRA